MLSLVLVLDPSTWMMLLVLQVLASYWNALADQSLHMTVFTLLMLVWGVKVNSAVYQENYGTKIYTFKYGFAHSSLHNWSGETGRR